MIIIKFFSGIGNQLYQYAIYLRLKDLYPGTIIKADITVFEDYELLNSGNGFSYGFGLKEFFGIDIPLATQDEIKHINYEMYFSRLYRQLFPALVKKYAGNSRLAKWRAMLIKKYRRMRECYITNIPFDAYTGIINELDMSRDYYVSGLWQNYQFIKPIEQELRETLKIDVFRTEEINRILAFVKNSNSVCMHIRRGDFTYPINRCTHDLCGSQYYNDAVKIICDKIDNPVFLIFSDDIEYCKIQFKNLQNSIFVSNNTVFSAKEEMFLISQCKAAIISNSTFAFWSVWLTDHPGKIVIAPKYSVKEKTIWHMFSLPEHWITINNLEG